MHNTYENLIEKARENGSINNWEEAIKCYEEAFQISEEIEDLLDYAICLLYGQNQARAEKVIDTIISLDEENFLPHFYKGLYYEYLEEYENAQESYLKSIELGYESDDIFFKVGYNYDLLGDIKRAKEYYQKALELNENEFFSNLNLGSIYEEENDLEKALYYTQKAHKSNPYESRACYNLGVIYGKLNDSENQLKYYLKELECDNPHYEIYFNLGVYYKDHKDYNQSKKYYLEAIKQTEGNEFLDITEKEKKKASIYYNIACVECLEKDFKKAKEAFKLSIMINSDILDYLTKDNEISNFRTTKEYLDLIKEVKK